MIRWVCSLLRHPRSSLGLLKRTRAIKRSGYFDRRFYLAHNTDIAGHPSPLLHFAQHGLIEGRAPSELFDPTFYRERYPDVAQAGIPPVLHYLGSGRAEGRWPRNFFRTDVVDLYADLPFSGSIESVAVVIEGCDESWLAQIAEHLSGLDRPIKVFSVAPALGDARLIEARSGLPVERLDADPNNFMGIAAAGLERVTQSPLFCRVSLDGLRQLGTDAAARALKELFARDNTGTFLAIRAALGDQTLGLLLPSGMLRPIHRALDESERALAAWLELPLLATAVLTPAAPLYWCSSAAIAPLLSRDMGDLLAHAVSRVRTPRISHALDTVLPALIERNRFRSKEFDIGPIGGAVCAGGAGECAIERTVLRWGPSAPPRAGNQSTAAIILNFNTSTESIEAARRLLSDEPELGLFIVDNASAEAEVRRLEKFAAEEPRAQLVHSRHNLGYAAGNNLGIQRALSHGFAYILITNPDAHLDGGAVSKMRRCFEGRGDLGAVSPLIFKDREKQVLWYAGAEFDSTTHLPRHIGLGEPMSGRFARPRALELMTGCVMLLSAQCIRSVGTIPDDYFLYFEDSDWSMRIRRAGWRIALLPDAHAVHLQTSNNSGGLPKSSYIYYFVRNRIRFMRRWRPEAMARLFATQDHFIEAYRAKVAAVAPARSAAFDALVRRAIEDGLHDRGGAADLAEWVLG